MPISPLAPPVISRFLAINLTISPNPSSVEASLSFDLPTAVETIQVFDVTGRLIQTIKGGTIDEYGKLINVQELPTGLYFLRAQDDKGHQFQEQMIIKRQ